MGSSMSTQQENFVNQAKKFYSDKTQAYAVELWEKGENMNMKYDDKVPKGTMPFDHDFGGMPVFQSEVQRGFAPVKVESISDGGTMVLKTENMMAFMPSGFSDGPTPNKINPFREEIGNPNGDSPQKCAASLCHIVTTPTNIRKYNAITCNVEDIPLLKELENVGKRACIQMLEEDDNVIGSLKWHLKQDGKITMKDGREVNTKLLDTDFVDSSVFIGLQSYGYESVKQKIMDSIVTTFHIGESASVGYIHSHTRPTCFDLTSRANMDNMASQDGYVKETNIDDVVEFISSEEFIKIQQDDTLCRTMTPPIMIPEPEPEDEGLTRTMTPPIENA